MFAFQIANSITASQVFAVEWMRERFKESKKKKTSFLATFGAEGYATLAWDQAPHLVGEGGGKRGSGGGGGLETRLWCHRSALKQMNLSLKCHVKFSSRMSAWAHYFAFVKKIFEFEMKY